VATEQEKFLKKFGNRVADVRKQRNITQENLADMVDLHRTYIGFIEQGKRNPSIGNIQKIAKALKVSLLDLFKNL
jgi:transcriptional regulator with XRE-family HTH domain